MTISNGKELSARIKADMSKVLASSPRSVGRIAINFMEDNFEKGGFHTGENQVNKWKPRKNDRSERGVLIGKQSGRLMKSGTIFRADAQAVVVGVPDNIAEYGKIHNTGGTTHPRVTEKMKKFAWFKYKESGNKNTFWKNLALTTKTRLTVKIPRRQFLGNSPELNRRLHVFFTDAFKKMLKS